MNKTEFFNKVARKADTQGQKIDVTIVSRVLRTAGDVLAGMSSQELMDTLQKWVKKP